MNNCVTLFFISLLINPLFSQSNEMFPRKKLDDLKFIAQYYLHWQEDSLDSNNIKVEPMVLLIGESISQFKSYNRLLSDTIFKAMKSPQEFEEYLKDQSLWPPHSQILYRIYKNYPANYITFTNNILGSGVLKYYEPIDMFDWEIKEDKLKWQKYTLQKATTEFGGRKWEAWFTPDIPISDGPYKFCGLPGLIVKINDTDNHYVFELLSIKPSPEGGAVEWPTDLNYFETDKKGFMQAYRNFMEDIISRSQEAGVTVDNPSMHQRAAERARRRNNPIELICE